jgi:hypothetical protein
MKLKDRTGEIKESKNYGLMKIIEYNGWEDIKVKFKTGSIVKTNYSNFKKGKVRDPSFPILYGIGYVGIGKYKPSIKGKKVVAYTTWVNMFERCYNPYNINKRLGYKNVFICEFFQNFQNFAEWYQENYYELPNEKVDLDKDIIKKGNKVYCPEYCSFVPRSINTLLIKCDKSRGKYPIGVSSHKNTDKYRARLGDKHLGYFSTPIKAFNFYKKEKEKQIKIMADKYKDVLNKKVYNSLMAYKVEITD